MTVDEDLHDEQQEVDPPEPQGDEVQDVVVPVAPDYVDPDEMGDDHEFEEDE